MNPSSRQIPGPVTRALSRLLVAFAASLPASAPGGSRTDPSPPTWPPPPAAARILYQRSISSPADLGWRRPWGTRVLHFLTGDDRHQLHLKPTGVAIDPDGSYLVADTDAGTVCLFDAPHRRFLRWDRFGPYSLKSPVAVARHADDCFAADSARGVVLAFSPEGRLAWAATNALERPSGLALIGRSLYVAEAGAHRISVFDEHGRPIGRFGRRGIEPGEFNFPTHLATTPEGRLVVTDAMNARIQILEPDGRPVRCIGSRGDGSGHFNRPKGVAVDAFGHLYVVDALFDNVQVFDAEGRFLLHFGANGRAPGEFWMPNGIAVGADHQVLVADTYNHRLQVFRYMADR